jgi:hypothetical protein
MNPQFLIHVKLASLNIMSGWILDTKTICILERLLTFTIRRSISL